MKKRREKEKEMREQAMISAAIKLFSEKGFNNASMDEIAKEAEFTKRTIYKYFESKEDLFFGVALYGFKTMFSYFSETAKKGKTGYEKIINACYGYYKFHKEYPELLRIMNIISMLKNTDTPRKREWLEFNNSMFKGMQALFELGKRDGTINKDIDSWMGANSFAFITTGFFNQFAKTGKSFTKAHKLSEDEFVSFVIELLGRSIK
jgi:AcrR family transcriptional regulator